MFPDWTWIVGLFVGAAIGSFLNVVIYRMPRGISLWNPRHSFCPSCRHRLLMTDMVPLLTWLFQKGRCKYCDAKISSRYFFVELVTGIIWAGIWWQYLVVTEDPAKAIAYMLGAASLVAVIWIDLELYTIPDQVNASLAFFGFGYNIYLYAIHSERATTWGLPSALAGWIAGVAVLWGIAFLGRLAFGRMAMGEGDIKLARGIGAMLFPVLGLISFGLAIGIGAVVGGIHAFLSARKRKAIGTGPVDMVELEAVFLARTDEGAIQFRITDTTQAALFPRKQTAELKPSQGMEYFRGEKHIQAESFWGDLSKETPILIHARPEGDGYVISAIGKDQNPLLGLLKSGLGYLLGIDIWGLFYVPLYRAWFHEDPFEVPADLETFDAGESMIPFGPYLALGAILTAIFAPQLVQGVQNYLNWNGLGQFSLEHGWLLPSLGILG